jgi:hypothetical protein
MSRDDLNPHGIARPSAAALARLELDTLEDRSRLDHHRPISSRTLDTIRAGLDLLDAVQNPGTGSGQRAAAARTLEAAGTTRADLEQLEQRARFQSFLDRLGSVLEDLDEPTQLRCVNCDQMMPPHQLVGLYCRFGYGCAVDATPAAIVAPDLDAIRAELDRIENGHPLRRLDLDTLDTLRAGLDALEDRRTMTARTYPADMDPVCYSPLDEAGAVTCPGCRDQATAYTGHGPDAFPDGFTCAVCWDSFTPARRDRVQLAGALELDTLEPCEHGHQECSTEPRGRCTNEAADDLDELDRRTLAARALEATRAAIAAPRPILAAFLEDGTYSVGQLAAVLDVSTWTPAELDRLEAAQDRDRLALALELDTRKQGPR